MDDENLAAGQAPEESLTAPVEIPLIAPSIIEMKAVEAVEVPVDPPETMKVSWGGTDTDPVETGRPVRLIRVYSNVDGRQLRVMKTADAADCLHIFVDVV